jgi:hypothetical protein
MGWFFLFREVRPRGDVFGDLGFREGKKDYKTSINSPPSQVTTEQIALAKQPIIN